jgi:DNA-binding NarL/FixJ family response regulator
MDRIQAIRPDARVVILTGDGAGPEFLAAATAAGAADFLGKDSALGDVLAAIRPSVDGQVLAETAALGALLRGRGPDGSAGTRRGSNWARLTPREFEVLDLMADALDPQAIALRLAVSPHTARGYVKTIMKKLGAHSQLEVVVVASRTGLLPAPRLVSG